MLYIVATPIGNLSDITYRAIETLKASDYILCEDTRHSLALLKHYDIHKPLKSYHKFNESMRQEEILDDLKQGLSISLISDAGTPGISDPGAQLIAACIANDISVAAIPGACAAITALCSSGLNTDRFQFWGFLPKKSQERARTFHEILSYPGTTICYETAHRLLDTLAEIKTQAGARKLVVARELTKKFEEIKRGNAAELIAHFETSPLKGEIVLLIEQTPDTSAQDWEHLTPQQHVAAIQEAYALTKQEAIVMVAKIRGTSKRLIYNALHSND